MILESSDIDEFCEELFTLQESIMEKIWEIEEEIFPRMNDPSPQIDRQ